MKATTYEPTGTVATALVQPDAIVVTIGALINKVLDNATEPQLVVIDQLEGVIYFGGETDADAWVTAVQAAQAGEFPPNKFEPGAINPVPFEGA